MKKMKIVNPLYDKVFKYLMENERFAKRILELILEVEVLELTLSSQETIVADEKRFLTLFRLDFKVLILHPDGTRQKVLIELQKSKFPTDIQRFRNYLGINYMGNSQQKLEKPKIDTTLLTKDEKLKLKQKRKQENLDEYINSENYPIITIYILGYKLDDLPFLAVGVDRNITDSVTKKTINGVNSFFINHLTHNSHIIQIKRLPPKRETKIENFLTLFNQAWLAEKNYYIDLEDIPEEFADMAEYLSRPVMDIEFRRQLEIEEEIDLAFELQEQKYLKQMDELIEEKEEERRQKEESIKREEDERRQKEESIKREEEERRQKEEERRQKEEERRQKEEERRQKEEERRQKEEERRQKEQLMINFAKKLKKYGESIEIIIKETGLSADEIENL